MSQTAPGDHLCLLSGDVVERQTIMSAFVSEGLERNERILYFFTDPDSAAAVFGFLERDTWQRHIASGQLSLAAVDDIYLLGDGFRPDLVVEALRSEAQAAVAAGWRGLRIVSEMAWVSRHGLGVDRLVEYEKGLHGVFSSMPVTIICAYDRAHFTNGVVDRFVQAHPARISADPLFHEEALRVFPTFDPPGLRIEGAVDARTGAVFTNALEGLQERCDAAGDSHLDLGDLHFIDLNGLRHLVWAASQLPGERRVVLHRLSSHHRDLIRLLRWDEVPKLCLDGGSP